ncbi:hypothetical protein WDU94_014138 [Cyamophila willieti]
MVAIPCSETRVCPRLERHPRGLTPYQRYGHSAVVHEGNIYIWGGRNDRFVCNQLFCFNCDTRQWSCPKVTGQIPEARDGHSACVHEGRMYIFGGYIDEETQFTQDVYALDLTTFHWSYIETWGEPPSYRDFHTANIINGRMFVWGGRGDESTLYHSGSEVYCPDLVYLDLKHFKWVRPNTSALDKESQEQILLSRPYLSPINNTDRPNDPMFGESNLIDNDDLHVLDFSPSLRTLALVAVIKYNLNTKCLPR